VGIDGDASRRSRPTTQRYASEPEFKEAEAASALVEDPAVAGE